MNEKVELVKARKIHHCEWCNGIISPGEIYAKFDYLPSETNSGDFVTVKAHIKCEEYVQEHYKELEHDDGVDYYLINDYFIEKYGEELFNSARNSWDYKSSFIIHILKTAESDARL